MLIVSQISAVIISDFYISVDLLLNLLLTLSTVGFSFLFVFFFFLHLTLLPSAAPSARVISSLPPTPLRRDQKVPWSVCTLESRSSSSRGGRWVLMSSWRGWRGTRRLSSVCVNAPSVMETATVLHCRAPHPRARSRQTWDQYVTRTLSCMTTSTNLPGGLQLKSTNIKDFIEIHDMSTVL